MKSLNQLTNDGNEIMGPATDLVISLVAVLIILLSIFSKDNQNKDDQLAALDGGNKDLYDQLKDCKEKLQTCKDKVKRLEDSIKYIVNECNKLDEKDIILKRIKESQLKIIQRIAKSYSTNYINEGDSYSIEIRNISGNYETIRIKNDATLQRISFGNTAIFENQSAQMKNEGKKILSAIGIILKEELNLIKEIQVQGHADADSKSLRNRNDNFDMASSRAIAIVRYLRDHKRLQIDPSEHVLYASSFGYYMPVEREYQDTHWDIERIKNVNDGSLGDKNRRIEIVINYKELK